MQQSQRGVYLELINYRQVMDRLPTPPVIVNQDIEHGTIAGKIELDRLIRTTYDGDALSIIPSCECGFLNSAQHRHVICPECKTPCETATEKPIQSKLWLRAPAGVRALMNPIAWLVLDEAFTVGGVSVLQYLTRPDYVISNDKSLVHRLRGANIVRGWNAFVDNFDHYIALLYSLDIYKPFRNGQTRDYVGEFIQQNRHLIFTEFLPIPNKLAIVAERTDVGTYSDESTANVQEAVLTILALDETSGGSSMRVKENATSRCIAQLAAYYDLQFKLSIGKKEGWNRKHIFGTRSPHTGRGVISSLTENHDYDEIHVPWAFAIALFELDILGKLMRLGYAPDDANLVVISAISGNDPITFTLMEKILDELITEHPLGKIPVVFQRNPSLARLSAQCLFITKVKKDPAINTISMGINVVKGPNADFDGDELNLLRIPDGYFLEGLSRLAPHLGVLDLQVPRSTNRENSMHGPLVATTSNWLYGRRA